MLDARVSFPLLAFGIPGFAQDERLSSTQPDDWSGHEPHQKSDVKNHLSPRYRREIHLCQPASQPDATGFSVAEPGAIKSDPSDFAKDFLAEHSSSGTALAPTDHLTGSIRPQAPTVSKSAQA
jgi:hypothetical protein